MQNRELIVDPSAERKREAEEREMGELALELYQDETQQNKVKRAESELCFTTATSSLMIVRRNDCVMHFV